MDEAIGSLRRQYPPAAPQRSTVAHERSYEEVRGLVLLLAEQPIGRDTAERLKRIVIRADRGWARGPKTSHRSRDFPSL